jgi:hypothetical protein
MQHFCFGLLFLLGIKMFAYCTGTRCLKNVCSFYYRYLAGTRPGKRESRSNPDFIILHDPKNHGYSTNHPRGVK